MHGGGILAMGCTPNLVNNTIVQNQANTVTPGALGGGLFAAYNASFTGDNNIIYFNEAFLEPQYYGSVSIDYSCCSTTLPGTGNITSNPMFVDPNRDDFNLQEGSPCIDTGNPASPPDPDGTRADMGALYFDQAAFPNLDVDLTYISGSPVPPGGGNIIYDLYVINNDVIPLNWDGWISVEYQGGPPQLLLMRSFTNYLPGWAVNRPNTYYPVLSGWPGGSYYFVARVGIYPDDIWDEDGFNFTKSGDIDLGFNFAGAIPTSGFPNPFDEVIMTQPDAPQPSEFAVSRVYPNPFNPRTAISYKLQAT